MDRALPTTPLGWPAYLWSAVLFAGPSSAEAPPLTWRPLAWLVVLPGLLLYPCVGFYLFEPDESRYAQIPAEMLRRGDLVVPTLQGEPYLDKPPLLYWCVMASYRVFGVSDWAARIVPALAVHGCVLITYLLGRRLMGERSAWWGAMVLALSPGFLGMTRLLVLDGLLTLFVAASLFAAFEAVRGERLRRGWWLAAALCCGLGVLTKGPVAVVLLVPPLWLYRRLSGRGVAPGWGAWIAFALVALTVALPWYLALAVRVPSFVSYFFWEHNVQRFVAPGIHVRGVFFYLPVLLLALLPGSLLFVRLVRLVLSSGEELARARSPELGFCLLAGGWCVLFFTLSACKLPTYVLPAFPFFALALGHALVHSCWRSSRLTPAVGIVTLALLLAAHYVVVPWYAWYRSPMSRPAEVLRLCADPEATVVCYPRNCDSVAFYLGRDDLKTYRSKDVEGLRYSVRTRPRTVILCTHRSSLRGLKQLLPPEVVVTREERLGLADIPHVPPDLMRPLRRLMGETALGLGDVAVVEFPAMKGRKRSAEADARRR
jgi:4-amino-4-deoxy-L-arabinose transferase-like glycosyltransferase